MTGIVCVMVGTTFATAVAEVIRTKKGVAAIGNAQIDTAQSKFGGASALFDGTGDYLIVGNTVDNDLALTGTTWTVEYWARINAHAGQFQFTVGIWDSVSPNGSVWYATTNAYNSTSKMGFSYIYGTNSLSGDLSFGSALATGTWQHHAFVRNGNTLTAYLDGVSQGTHDMTGRTIDITGYNSSTNTTMKMTVGAMTGASGAYNGHLDEIRISNTARYTTGFTPSTTPFVNDANTVLLLHMNGTDASTYFEDDNGVRAQKNGVGIGNANIDNANSKFGGTSYNGDGTGDRIEIAGNGTFAPSGDFTIEAWARPSNFTSNRVIFTQAGVSGANIISVYAAESTGTLIYYANSGSRITGSNLSTNTWYHVAISRSGSSTKLFVDGTQVGSTYTDSTAIVDGTFYVGSWWDGTSSWSGWIDEIRYSNSARYTANFTAPSAAFTNDANTLLLLHMDGTDASTVFRDDNGDGRTPRGIAANGNAQVDTAQYKFGGASALFDGTGDYLTVLPANFDFTTDFTIECFARLNAKATKNSFFTFYNGATYRFHIAHESNNDYGFVYYNANSGAVLDSLAGSLGYAATNTAQWYHVALVRSGNTFTLYVDGTSRDSVTQTPTISVDTCIIGAESNGNNSLNGWLDEVRISKTARYTANFTPSTTPFQNDANTLLLLHMDGTDASTVFIDDNGVTPTHQYS